MFAGLSAADIATAASGVRLREGCRDALAAAAACNVPVTVVSVNWSAEFIAAALKPLPTRIRFVSACMHVS